MKSKILYIAREPQKELSGGASVDKRNLSILQELYGKSNVIIEYLPKTTMKNVILSLLTLSSYGVTLQQEKNILQLQTKNKCSIIFIEGSLSGYIIKKISQIGGNIILHMHNIETLLYKQKYNTNRGVVSYLCYRFVQFNERLSVKYSDYIISLNKRDNDELEKMYNRKANLILPITFPMRKLPKINVIGKYLLFVGSDFFPNVEGVKWFITEVAPYIDINVKIVGGCCNNHLLINLSLPENVSFEGYVNDVDPYYLEAAAVIAPIFSGSGMKTKTVEAMSFGKTIIGTDEAFVGIEGDLNKIGALCNNSYEFIKAIQRLQRNVFNDYTYTVFMNRYTHEIFRDRLNSFINTVDK